MSKITLVNGYFYPYIGFMTWTQIIRRMTALGLNFTQLADATGLERKTLTNWHGGKSKPHPDLWAKLERTLDEIEERQAERRAK